MQGLVIRTIVLGLLSLSVVSALECYSCIYVQPMDQIPGGIKLPSSIHYGKECSTGRMPSSFKTDCHKEMKDLHIDLPKMICGSVQVNLTKQGMSLPVWARSCMPKDAFDPKKIGKCQHETLAQSEYYKIQGVKEALAEYVAQPEKVQLDSCVCEGDSCNGVYKGGSGYLIMIMGIIFVTGCNKYFN